ncbi:MAG: SpoIIE family protein phosphatase [Armatimonadota bacterium]|nr:SpoIIE family protein phosphatase [Armatimonadota bacterium]
MVSSNNTEAASFQCKLVHNLWLQRAAQVGYSVPHEESNLAWELLAVYAAAGTDSKQAVDYAYKAAYELASTVLTRLPAQEALRLYRDILVEAMLDQCCPQYDNSGVVEKAVCRNLIAFANIVSSAFCEANSDLLKRTIRQERAERLADELRMAKRIQMHLLPKVIPDVPGFQFAGRLIPAEEVGGDYWSVKYKKDGNIITLKLADITGHGLAAATLVAAVKFISGGFYQGSSSAAEVMKKTNRVLTIETPRDIMVTMVYGWLRPERAELSIVNAGHSPVFLCSGDSCQDIPPTGPVLGVIEDADFEELHMLLKPGDILFLGSDGITEAGMPEPFGVERLKAVVSRCSNMSADEIADAVVKEVIDYAGKPRDDISLLVVKAVDRPSVKA